MTAPIPTNREWVSIKEYVDINNAVADARAVESEINPSTGKIRYYIEWYVLRNIDTGEVSKRVLAIEMRARKKGKSISDYVPDDRPTPYDSDRSRR